MSKKKKKQRQAADAAPVEEPVAEKTPLTDAEAKAAAYGESLRAEGTLAFYSSLKALRADDIAPVSVEKDRSARQKKALLIGIFVLLLGVFLYAAWSAVYDVVTYKLSDDSYTWLSENFSMKNDRSATERLYAAQDALALPNFTEMLSGNFTYKKVTTGEEEAQLAIYRSKLQQLKSKYPDTYGWISIDGTNIDYPIMQGENEYYLHHDFSGNSSSAGAIYIDSSCRKKLTDNPAAVIYGHNIRTRGIMFNQLLRYMDKSFFDAHPDITVYTPDGVYTYTIFSFFQTTADSGYIRMDFASEEDFAAHFPTLRSNSWYQRAGMGETVFTADSRVLVLSTCTNGAENERYAVIALLTDKLESTKEEAPAS